MTEALTADELAYHQRLVAQVREAQAAWTSWSRHLSEKYRLGQRDALLEDGSIVRAAPAEDPPEE